MPSLLMFYFEQLQVYKSTSLQWWSLLFGHILLAVHRTSPSIFFTPPFRYIFTLSLSLDLCTFLSLLEQVCAPSLS